MKQNFLQLDKKQYINVLWIAQQVTLWAKEQLGAQATVHLFDKTGEMAGQTQPLFHVHLVIVKNKSETLWGKVALFFRMLFPASPLPSDELEKRVSSYRESLGQSISQIVIL